MATLPELLIEILNEHNRLLKRISKVPADQREAAILPGGWSIKTTLAHITAWEKLTLTRLEAVRTSKVPDIPPVRSDREINAFNAGLFARTEERAYEEVFVEFERSHKKMVETVSTMDESFFKSEIKVPWTKRQPVWEMIGANTCWHYTEHSEAIEKWLSTI